jgi:hypothetical protein
MLDRALFFRLLELRYRLLWSAVRTRTGRVTLFIIGWLVVMLMGGFLFLGGLGAVAAAVRSGRSELVLRVACGVFFVLALGVAIVLGVGVSSAFSEDSLRRFPMGAAQRFVARHMAAVLDPLWLLLLALYEGLALGAAVFGEGWTWVNVPAAFLLLLANYLVASSILALVNNVMRTRFGRTALVVALVLAVCIGPGLLIRLGAASPGLVRKAAVEAVTLTPPLIAARAWSSNGMPSVTNLAGLLAWVCLLTAVLVVVERWRPMPRRLPGAAATWDTVHDRVARLFGAELAPLAGKMLRYCTRSPHVRIATVGVLPSFVMFALFPRRESIAFWQALAAVAFLAGNSAGAYHLNLFGFDGSGFRRYLLLPVPPSSILFVASAVVLIPGSVFVLAAVLLWVLYSPAYLDPRSLAMFAGSGLTGWLVVPTVGIWTSILAPTSIEFDRTLGNKLSLAANAVMVGSIVAFFGFQILMVQLHVNDEAVVRHWWVMVASVPLAAVAYLITIGLAGRVMGARRERMLEAIDAV